MAVSLQLITNAGCSLRGVGKIFSLLKPWFDCPVPAATTVRNWLLRVGLFVLMQALPREDDWIFLVDATAEWGGGKCLVVLAVRRSQLAPGKMTIDRQDVTLLWLEVRPSWTGEAVYEILSHLAFRCGVPVQIVTDHGSDLVYAVGNLCEDHAEMRATYDVTHALGRQVLASTAADDRWKTFREHAQTTRKAVSYGAGTAAGFLAPPSQNAATRCEHVDRLAAWGVKMLDYAEQGDFSQIDAAFTLDATALAQLGDPLDDATRRALVPLEYRWRDDRATFRRELQRCLDAESFDRWGEQIMAASDLGRRQFELRFGWLAAYEQPLRNEWLPMSQVMTLAEKQVKHDGLHKFSARDLKQRLAHENISQASIQPFVVGVLRYLGREGKGVSREAAILGSSDAIESLFGKYKSQSSKQSVGGFGANVLTLPLSTVALTTDLVRRGLESVSELDLSNWISTTLGVSTLARRRQALSQSGGTKPAGTVSPSTPML